MITLFSKRILEKKLYSVIVGVAEGIRNQIFEFSADTEIADMWSSFPYLHQKHFLMTLKKGILISFQNAPIKVNEKHYLTFSNTNKIFYLLWIIIVSDLHYSDLSHFYIIGYYEKLYRKYRLEGFQTALSMDEKLYMINNF